MRVDLLGFRLVQRHKAVQDIIACGRVIVASYNMLSRANAEGEREEGNQLTLVIRKVVLHRTHGQLLPESVNLVQKQDDARLDEPPRVADGVKES